MRYPQSVKIACLLCAVILPTVARAQFTFTTNADGTLDIASASGFRGAMTIPDTTNGLPITSIGDYALEDLKFVTSIAIGTNLTSMDAASFAGLISLTAITVDTNNPAYSSMGGVLFDKNQTTLIACPVLDIIFGSYTIPASVTSIGNSAFFDCRLTNVIIGNSVTNIGDGAFSFTLLTGVIIGNSVNSIGASAFTLTPLTNVTIPSSVTNIGSYAFNACDGLQGIYFQGNAPGADMTVFSGDTNAIVYYLPGTTGWANFAEANSIPTVLWNPQAQTNDGSFGVQLNQFGFNIIGSSNLVVVVEACTNLSNPIWSPLSTNTLNTFIGTNGMSYFSDPQWTNYPSRFYGFSWP